jgi:hypothetical protein
MPTNHYFSKGTINEQYLYEDLVIEALQIYGHDLYYLPRKLVNKDQLFGEDPLSSFNDSYMVEMYMDTVEGYEGEKEIITRFGLEIRDETTFMVSRRRWLDLVSLDANLITSIRPNEGDWIYMPDVQRLFEISFVDKDDPFYQVNNLPVYKLYCRTVEYSSERLDTGIDSIDQIETTYTGDELLWQFIAEQTTSTIYNEKFALERGTDLYSDGFIDLETATDTGYLISEDESGFDAVLMEDSTAKYSFYIINEDYNLTTSDPLADNEWIEDAVHSATDPVLDFTERNPFGEPTESI